MTTTHAETDPPRITDKVAEAHGSLLGGLRKELSVAGVYCRLVEYHHLLLRPYEFAPSSRSEPELLVYWPEESLGGVALRVRVSQPPDEQPLYVWESGSCRVDDPRGAAAVIAHALEMPVGAR